MEEGSSLAQAVRAAQSLGLAEADPGDDLRGIDTARKISIICHAAFGVRLHPSDIRCQGIEALAPETVRRAREAGETFRLVGSCVRGRRGYSAEVRPRRLALTHPLAECRDEENRVVIRPERGPATLLSGKGAGRWPTSESVLADLLDLSRAGRRRDELRDTAA
jgi:homoserine dehydrogenase